MTQFSQIPLVQPELAREIAPGVILLPDQRIDLVPNIGIVSGTDAVLVVDCGMGKINGDRVLNFVREIAGSKPLIFTSTHFHPEHAFGAESFKGHSTILINTTQSAELREKGPLFLNIFRGLGPSIREALDGTELVAPDETYQGERSIDLGGKQVILRELPAHTRGDQIIFLPAEQVLFTGDLIENRLFPIFSDQDSSLSLWHAALTYMSQLSPATIVPGHGESGTITLLQNLQDHLNFVRSEVNQRIQADQTLAQIDQECAHIIKEHYPDWGNDMMIPLEIRGIYADITNTPLQPIQF